MKNKKIVLFIVLIVLTVSYIYTSVILNLFQDNVLLDYLFLSVIVIEALFMIFTKENIVSKPKEGLTTSLIENSDTVCIMIDSKTKKPIYLSNNVEEILGIAKSDKSTEEIVYKILNIPEIKAEIDSWDKVKEYIGQMIQFDNPKYNYEMWIRVKIFSFKEKSHEYYVIRIVDATKEHERQHLLIQQASDIKSREIKLDQITSAIYDVEINVNLTTDTYELKYFKKDNLYFGEEKRGKYSLGLEEILKYINEKDKKEVLKSLSLENLKEHFAKFELNSFSIRYRIGSEIKNNIWLESTVFFISNKNRDSVSILTKNVTENAESIKEQNVLLQNALNDAKQASKSKTDLITTISHDIRTPLTNIMGLSESLLSRKLDEDIKEDIKNINSSSNDLLSIIDGLLNPSNVEKKLIKKEEKEYSILKMFKVLEAIAKSYIGNKKIKVNLTLDSNLPVILYGDYKRISWALTEIINNSIKYTDEGEINIIVRGEKKNSKVNIKVEINDTGCGIEEEKLDEIMHSKENGGINSVKKLMKLLGGTLEIESKVNEYTKVVISYDQKIVEDNKIREMMKSNKTAEEFILTGKKILIVDDNELNLKVTKRLLEPYKVDVTLIESGEECLDLIKEGNKFDLIMLDQMMPGIDGVTTLNKLKEIDGFNTPVVVLTADAMEGRKEQYLSNGFDDYISKPIDKGELSRVLKKFIKDV